MADATQTTSNAYDFEVTKIVLAPVPGFPSLFFADRTSELSIALCLTPLYAVSKTPLNTLSYTAKVTSSKERGLTAPDAATACRHLFQEINTDMLAADSLDNGEDYTLELIIGVDIMPRVASEEDLDVYLVTISIPVDHELYTMGSSIVWAQSEAIVSTRQRMMQSAEQNSRSIN